MIEPPPYGHGTLAEVVPSVLASLGVEGFANTLGLSPTARACVLVVDGLGWELVRDHPAGAPFLATLVDGSEPISAVFPSTTAASLASLGTGLPPGEHGLVGYTFAVPGRDRPMNALRWELYGIGPHVDLAGECPPERVQPHPTLMQRAEVAGMPVSVVGPRDHERSPLTRAILRGGRYVVADEAGALVERTSEALSATARAAVYAYYPWLDAAAHIHGVASERWDEQLRIVDGIVAGIAERLRPGAVLYVTADHGMVDADPGELADVGDEPAFLAGVRALGGEARMRHVYARPGAAGDVLATWSDLLAGRARVMSDEQVVAEGWFGPRVEDHARPRIGDVVAAMIAPGGVVQREVDPLQASLRSHHGSATPRELRVPLFRFLP